MKKILITLGGVVLILLVLGWATRGKIKEFFSVENRVKANLSLAIDHLNDGKPDAALRSLGGALRLNPNNAEAHFYVAKAYEMQNHPAEAYIKEYRKAIELKPDYAEARQGLGIALYQLKDYEGARREFEKMIEIEPLDVSAHNNLGLLYVDMKRYGDAEIYFKRAIELMPDYDFALNNLGKMYFDQGRWTESKVTLERSLSVNPKSAKVHSLLAQIAEKQKDKKKAMDLWQKAIALGLEGEGLREAQSRLDALKK